MEDLVRLANKPLAFAGSAVIFLGLIYLGIQLKDGSRGGGEILKAFAMIAAGGTIVLFAVKYGFVGF